MIPGHVLRKEMINKFQPPLSGRDLRILGLEKGQFIESSSDVVWIVCLMETLRHKDSNYLCETASRIFRLSPNAALPTPGRPMLLAAGIDFLKLIVLKCLNLFGNVLQNCVGSEKVV